MPQAVSKGGTLPTKWVLYLPTAPGIQQADPDEFPEGPRFALHPAGSDTPVAGFTNLPYTRRYAPGVYAFNLPIPFAAGELDPGDYEIRISLATVGGQALVGRSGAVPSASFTVVAAANDFPSDRPYVTAAELGTKYGVANVEAHEIGFAQQILDDWMHRSLWPTVIEKERQPVPEDSNRIQLDVTPVIRLFNLEATEPLTAASMQGRYGTSRRNRRRANFGSDFYMDTLAAVGSPAQFMPIDPMTVEAHLETGQLWVPTGGFLTAYTQVEITYEAGLRVIPSAVKWAVAETIALVRLKHIGPISQWQQSRVSFKAKEGLITDEVERRLGKYQLQFLR